MTREQYELLLSEPETYKKVANGLGPNRYRKLLQNFLPDGMFRPAADRHDVAFLCGGEDTKRKREDAALFYNALAWKKKHNKKHPKYTYWALAIRAVLYFESHKYWNYRAYPISFERLMEIARESENEQDCKERCFSEPV